MKIATLLLVFVLLGITACTKEKTEPDFTKEIVGSYRGWFFTINAQNDIFDDPQDTLTCQFTISKLDNKQVYIEFLTGLESPKLTAGLLHHSTDENYMYLRMQNTQISPTVSLGGVNSPDSNSSDGGYERTTGKLFIMLKKTAEGKVYWIHIGGSNKQ